MGAAHGTKVAVLANHGTGLSIIIMHHTEQKLLFYLRLMTVYIGMLMKLLKNGLWIY